MDKLQKKIYLLIALHTIWYILYLLSIPFLILYDWGALYAFSLSVLMIGSWRILGGCILFNLENKYRKQTIPPSDYTGTFLTHYLNQIFSLSLNAEIIKKIDVTVSTTILLISAGILLQLL